MVCGLSALSGDASKEERMMMSQQIEKSVSTERVSFQKLIVEGKNIGAEFFVSFFSEARDLEISNLQSNHNHSALKDICSYQSKMVFIGSRD